MALSVEDTKFNRQINFLVMREVWKIIRGRAKKYMNVNRTIYETFGIGRERYTRAIDTGRIRLTKKELDWLVSLTGIEKEIFTGEKRFQFSGITLDDWRALFECRDEEDGEFKIEKKALLSKTVSKIVREDVEADRNLMAMNNCFSTLAVREQLSIKDATALLRTINFERLDMCTEYEVGAYLSVLREHVEMAETIVKYKEMKYLTSKN